MFYDRLTIWGLYGVLLMNSIAKISAIAVLILVAVGFSGCCCCYGVDGFTSKYQKSADAIQFPQQITAGWKDIDVDEV